MNLSKIILLISLLFANLAWLLNPHACCPRAPLNCEFVEFNCCSMKNPHGVVNMGECAPKNMPAHKAAGPFFNQESQLSKGVMLSISDATSDSTSLYQLQQTRITQVIGLKINIIPDSVTLPFHKKPPRIQSA